MFSQFPKKTLFSKFISGLAAVSFILTSVPIRSYASVDKLKAPTVNGLKEVEKELKAKQALVVQERPETTLAWESAKLITSPKILVLSNKISLLRGAMTGGYNIGHAIGENADGGVFNHSEWRAMLEGSLSAVLESLTNVDKHEVAKGAVVLSASAKKDYIERVKRLTNLPEKDIEGFLPEIQKQLLYAQTAKNLQRQIETLARRIVNKTVNSLLKEVISRGNTYSFKQTVLCVGETKTQYDDGRTNEILEQDLKETLDGITQQDLEKINLRVAYEARWVIGKGVIPPEVLTKVNEIHGFIKQRVGKETLKLALSVDYGASVNKGNIDKIAVLPNVDGFLIGGAAKSPEEVGQMIDILNSLGLNKIFNFGMNWKAEGEETGLKPVNEFVEILKARDLSKIQIAISTPNVAPVKKEMVEMQKYLENTSPVSLLASLDMAEAKEILASEAKSTEILDGIVKRLYSLSKAKKLELSRLEAVVVLGKLASLTETETFSRIRKIVHRLSAEQLAALKGIAKADLFKNDDLDRKLAIVLKPTNIFVSAGNAVIFSEGAFNSWLNEWEPGQNIVAIKTLKGAKQLSAAAFVRQNFYSGGVFARYQVAGLHLGEPVSADGKTIDSIIVPEDKNAGRPEMRILYFGPEISNKDAVGIMRKLGIGPDVVAEYGPGKDEGGGKGGTYQALRIKEFIQMGLPVACASPVNKDGIKVGLKTAGLNPKIAFKEALFSFNRDKVTSNTWAVDTLSCTSNAMISAIVAVHEAFGVESGSGETVHAQTASNAVFPEPSGRERDPVDVLRGFSIIQDIQEASTGAAKNLFKIIPELEGNFPITAKRVGAITGSAFTITMNLKKEVTEKEVRDALRNFAKNKSNGMVRFYEGIPGVASTPLDTNSIVGWSSVSIIDGFMIQVLNNKKTIIIKGLYDNQSAAPGQIAHRWAPWMVDARRAKEILTPAPVQIKTAEVATVPYMSTWGKAEFEGKKVLERLDLNVSGAKGEIKSTKKISEAIRTMVYPLENGAKTVVVISHNGRPDGKVDKAYSMGPVSEEIQKALEAQGYNYKAVFHENSITAKGLAKGLKQKIVPGAINILEDSRFYEGEEGNDPSFAAGLADLVDNGVFIFDAFGAGERTGGSLDLVANYVDSIGLGFIMENEYKNLQGAVENLYGLILGGGPKVSEKVPMIKNVLPNMKKDGFIIIGTGPVPAFLKALYNIEIGPKVSEQDLKYAQDIITLAKQYNIRLVLPSDFVMLDKDLTQKADGEKSWVELKKIPEGAKIHKVTLEQLKQGTFIDAESGQTLSAKALFPYDIYERSIKEFGDVINSTPSELWDIWNGAVGINEIPQFETGSSELCKIYEALKAKRGLVGSDSGAMGDQFCVSDKLTFVSTGGSSALAFMQGKELLVMNGLKKAQAVIDIANGLKVSAKKVRNFLLANKASLETLSDKDLIAAIAVGVKAKDIEKEAQKVETAAAAVTTKD